MKTASFLCLRTSCTFRPSGLRLNTDGKKRLGHVSSWLKREKGFLCLRTSFARQFRPSGIGMAHHAARQRASIARRPGGRHMKPEHFQHITYFSPQ